MTTSLTERFALEMRAFRKERNERQVDFASQAGVPKWVVEALESGSQGEMRAEHYLGILAAFPDLAQRLGGDGPAPRRDHTKPKTPAGIPAILAKLDGIEKRLTRLEDSED